MLDLKAIRETPDAVDRALAKRGISLAATHLLSLDSQHRNQQTAVQQMQARRNDISRQVGELKRRGENADALMAEVTSLKDQMAAAEAQEQKLSELLEAELARLPNLPADDVPEGKDEAANVVVRTVGKSKDFSFTAREHDELGTALGLMDFETAAKISGARFVVLKGALVRLERALAAFMLDLHTKEFGYTEIAPPLLVRDESLYGTGQLPKFSEDLFKTTSGLWLIPTSEVSLTNVVADTIVSEDDLPIRMTAYTPCFRSEAGAAGKDTRGMIRQHQFTKVELVSIAHPDKSDEEHERMTACAEEVLKRLELPYRVALLCAGDMGFSARKTYDLEVWLPGQKRYREISSCSNCGDFQARRMKARLRSAGSKNTRFVHTLNGSGLAVGRTLVAILENYQQENGMITMPAVLQPYMDGIKVISSHG
ncbi:MAG: serine--tRNA ligase [Alphaproteobacteria bacterium]